MTEETVDKMASQGRKPSYGQGMQLRGFRSRPGAPIAGNTDDRTGMRREKTGFTNKEDWGNFFKGNSPTGVRLGYRANSPSIAAAAFPVPGNLDQQIQAPIISDNPVPAIPVVEPGAQLADVPTSTDYLGSVISNAQNWMKRFGNSYA